MHEGKKYSWEAVLLGEFLLYCFKKKPREEWKELWWQNCDTSYCDTTSSIKLYQTFRLRVFLFLLTDRKRDKEHVERQLSKACLLWNSHLIHILRHRKSYQMKKSILKPLDPKDVDAYETSWRLVFEPQR